jgi:dipeptidyl aminopeptidase/acylaminoacyl peptidase
MSRMRPEDLSLLTTPSDPQIHPDNRRVAFVETRIDTEDDCYRRQILLHDGELTVPFTAGPIDFLPRWSADGRRLAFLRATDLKKPIAQVAVMPAGGGEAKVITSFALGAEYLAWSPDGFWLCVVAKSWGESLKDLSEDDRNRKPKRITRFPYRFDNRGWLHDRIRQLWLVDPNGENEPWRLTEGDFDEVMPAWHPDCDRIVFLTDRHPRQGLEAGSDVYQVTLDGALTQPTRRGGWFVPVYAPDGTLHLIGDPAVDYPRLHGIWRIEGDGTPVPVTEHLDRSTLSIGSGTPPLPKWMDGDLYTTFEDSGRMEVVRIDTDGNKEVVLGGDRVVTGFDLGLDGRLAATFSSVTIPGELVSIMDAKEQQLTAYSEGEVPEFRPAEHWRANSDATNIDVWVMLPEGKGPFPVLLNIHGGPATQYGFGFFDEFQVYTGAGYAVVACNPRGSSGRGFPFVRAVRGEAWGEVDLADINAGLESALNRYPQLDRDRIGIMGGSYGGFMTAWAIGHDRRYRSAIVERALLSFPSFAGTSDIGPFFGPNYLETTDLQPMWLKSPLAVADQIRTPTLIIHSEDDFRCPIEQAEQLLMILWQNDVEAEMLRFPGEGHELSRSGKPKHRIERFQAILDWHDRHLTHSLGSS